MAVPVTGKRSGEMPWGWRGRPVVSAGGKEKKNSPVIGWGVWSAHDGDAVRAKPARTKGARARRDSDRRHKLMTSLSFRETGHNAVGCGSGRTVPFRPYRQHQPN